MHESSAANKKRLYRFGQFRLHVRERVLQQDGRPVPLPRKVFDLLVLLVESAGQLRTREELVVALWPNSIVEGQGLTTKVHALRKALGDEGHEPEFIETVRGVGYRFIAPVTIEQGGASAPRGHWSRLAILGAALVLVFVAGALVWDFFVSSSAGRAQNGTAPSLAVLPFENLSADSGNTYFVSGIQDEILTRLAAIRSLKVISRTSTAQYASHPENLRAIAHELNVTDVLEGSVQKSGNDVHINVQLIDARTYAHIWAHSYDRKLNNVFDVEGDVAQRIADALRAELLPEEAARLARPPTADSDAYLAFLKANYLADQLFGRGNAKDPAKMERRAVALYHRATTLDPRFSLAYARLSVLESQAYWFATSYDSYQHQRMPEAERAAKKALALDPDLPQAHLAMGYVDYYGHRDYSDALIQFEKARKGLSNDATVVAAIAFIHRRQNHWVAALDELHEAALRDPRNPRWTKEIGITLIVMRRYREAEEAFAQALAIEPHDYYAMVRLAEIQLLTGMPQQAQKILGRIPDDVDLAGLIASYRFQTALYERKPAQALRVLGKTQAWILGVSYYDVPSQMLEAEAWSLERKPAQAHRAYKHALGQLHVALKSWPDDPTLWDSLGITEASLGDRGSAVRAGVHATEILPVGKDAFYGAVHLYELARIYARIGDAQRAVRLLARLLAMPAGDVVSVPSLRLDPAWDRIRSDPGFQALLGNRANDKVEPPTTTGS